MTRTRTLLAALLITVAMAACAPATVVPERDGEQVTITVDATVNLYSVNLAVLNATTTDPRCSVQGATDSDVGCILGDLTAGTSATVVVTGQPGQVHCAAFAFIDDAEGIRSIRAYPCKF